MGNLIHHIEVAGQQYSIAPSSYTSAQPTTNNRWTLANNFDAAEGAIIYVRFTSASTGNNARLGYSNYYSIIPTTLSWSANDCIVFVFTNNTWNALSIQTASGASITIEQTTGSGTDVVMSQAAVTNELNVINTDLGDISAALEAILGGTPDSKAMPTVMLNSVRQTSDKGTTTATYQSGHILYFNILVVSGCLFPGDQVELCRRELVIDGDRRRNKLRPYYWGVVDTFVGPGSTYTLKYIVPDAGERDNLVKSTTFSTQYNTQYIRATRYYTIKGKRIDLTTERRSDYPASHSNAVSFDVRRNTKGTIKVRIH